MIQNIKVSCVNYFEAYLIANQWSFVLFCFTLGEWLLLFIYIWKLIRQSIKFCYKTCIGFFFFKNSHISFVYWARLEVIKFSIKCFFLYKSSAKLFYERQCIDRFLKGKYFLYVKSLVFLLFVSKYFLTFFLFTYLHIWLKCKLFWINSF